MKSGYFASQTGDWYEHSFYQLKSHDTRHLLSVILSSWDQNKRNQESMHNFKPYTNFIKEKVTILPQKLSNRCTDYVRK